MKKMKLEGLSEGEEFIVMWQFRLLGHFKTALIEVICLADEDNLDKLRLGFPYEVDGYEKYTQTSGWWEEVKKKAGIDWE